MKFIISSFFIADSMDAEDEKIQLLPAHEQDRAFQFKNDWSRAHFVMGRLHLRELIGDDKPIQLEEQGRPFVSGLHTHFNLSHSGQWIYIAHSAATPIGIDIEWVQDPLIGFQNLRDMSETFLSKNEKQNFIKLPAELQEASLWQVWVSKEAVLKAAGIGFSIPPEDLTVQVDPRFPMELLVSPFLKNYQIHKIKNCPFGYLGAVAKQSDIQLQVPS